MGSTEDEYWKTRWFNPMRHPRTNREVETHIVKRDNGVKRLFGFFSTTKKSNKSVNDKQCYLVTEGPKNGWSNYLKTVSFLNEVSTLSVLSVMKSDFPLSLISWDSLVFYFHSIKKNCDRCNSFDYFFMISCNVPPTSYTNQVETNDCHPFISIWW